MSGLASIQSVLGLFTFVAVAWLLSEKRSEAHWRIALAGLGIQLGIAILVFNLPWIQNLFLQLNNLVLALQEATDAGTAVVFGYLGGGEIPFEESTPGSSYIMAFGALPLIIVIGALTSLLTYWKVLPFIIRMISLALERSMGVGGAVGLAAAANIFTGMIEAPLFIRQYMSRLTRSELFMVMTLGMATIAGTVLVLYATFVGRVLPNAIGHLLTASVISAPAAIMIARIMVPSGQTVTDAFEPMESGMHGAVDAVTQGALNGMKMFLNIIALLIAFVALVHLANIMLGWLPEAGGGPITLERLLGYLMAPVCWLMGIPWSEAPVAGSLMGVKTILNEFLAYIQMSQLPPGSLTDRSELIMTYALCGFANFGSLGIMIGGLSTLAPERREEIIGLGMKSIVSGTLATCTTGAVVGVLTGF
jgi:CNT family concentrative nucleoside transporter